MSLSPKQAQLAENQRKIDQHIANFTAKKNAGKASNQIQTTLSNQGIGQKTKEAQQKLSDMFGIPTFDAKGGISTVPATGVINPDISVGTGRYSESAFKKSLAALTNTNNDILSAGAKAFNDILLAPIASAFTGLFDFINLGDLSDEQQNQIRFINKEIEAAEKERKNNQDKIDEIISKSRAKPEEFKNMPIGIILNPFRRKIDQIDTYIEKLTAQREDMLKSFRAVRDFTKQVQDKVEQLNNLIDKVPFTVHDKTELGNLINQSSQLLEKIVGEKIAIVNADMVALNLAMQSASHKFNAPIQEGQSVLDEVLKGLSENLEGAGKWFSEGIISFGESLIKGLFDLFDITPEKLSEAQELAQSLAVQSSKGAQK